MAKTVQNFLARTLLLAVCLGVSINVAAAAELLMLERPGCVWCMRWNEQIAPAYPKTAEGRVAPLRRVDLSKPWPKDLAGIAADRFTPTFILTSGGREIARLRGYPGDEFFWPLLGEMLAKLH